MREISLSAVKVTWVPSRPVPELGSAPLNYDLMPPHPDREGLQYKSHCSEFLPQ